jgi:hypothetical protein
VVLQGEHKVWSFHGERYSVAKDYVMPCTSHGSGPSADLSIILLNGIAQKLDSAAIRSSM